MVADEKIGLEDAFSDILNKAQKGQRLSLEDLAERTTLPPEIIQNLKRGDYQCVADRQPLEKLAFALNLHAPSLIHSAENSWYPETPWPASPEKFPGLAMFTTWYGDMTVNAYIVWDPESKAAASFDTGASCQPMLDFLHARSLQLQKIFITHTHQDHLADIQRLCQETQAESYGSAVENPLGLKPLQHGDGFVLGNLRIRILGTAGHTPGGLSYFIQGLEKPMVVVGDALFAGSMGGAAYAYQEALKNNQEHVLSLPLNTVICPGHGPLSTVGEERANNPFFPDLKH